MADALKTLDAAAKKKAAYVAAYADFDRFFDAAVRIKAKFEAFNSAIAVRIMADLALERLAQLEAEDKPQEPAPEGA